MQEAFTKFFSASQVKGKGVIQNMTQRKQFHRWPRKKTIQVSSFLLMHCDLRRKLEVVFLKGQFRSHIKITRERSLKLHILQIYRVGLSGGWAWKSVAFTSFPRGFSNRPEQEPLPWSNGLLDFFFLLVRF